MLRFSGYSLIIIFLSILGTLGLIGLGFLNPAEQASGKYAILIYDNTFDENEIQERLESKFIKGIISESNQWVFLNNFDNIEQIPLKEYDRRILPFDPRNDGYAQKFQSMFIQENKRLIYIPVFTGIERSISSAMDEIPYSLEFLRKAYVKAPYPVLILLVFTLAVSVFFIFRKLRKIAAPAARQLLPCLPLFAVICSVGSEGFALATLLSALAVLLGLSREIISQKKLFYRTFKIYFFLLASLTISYGLISFFSGLSLFFTLPAFIISIAIIMLSSSKKNTVKTRPYNTHGHKRFIPVTIIKQTPFNYNFSIVMLPLALAAIAFSFSAFFNFGSKNIAWEMPSFDLSVTETDFINHYFFQSTFSQRPLYATRGQEDYNFGLITDYKFDSDGLYLEAITREKILTDFTPAFPLEDLLEDLSSQDGSLNKADTNSGIITDLLIAFVPWLFIILGFFNKRKKARLAY